MKIANTRPICSLLIVLLFFFLDITVHAKPNPITLQKIIQHALQSDLRILKAESELASARLELEAAKQSFFIPQISVSVVPLSPLDATQGASNNWGRVSLSAGLSLPIGTVLSLGYTGNLDYKNGQFTGGITGELTQPLFRDPNLTSNNLDFQRKQIALSEAEQNLQEIKRQVVLDTIDGALTLIMEQKSIEVAQSRMELAHKRLEAVQSKAEQGQAAQTDLLSAQIDLRQSELNLATLQDNHALNQEKFLRSLGLDNTLSLSSPRIDYAHLSNAAEALLKQQEIAPAVIQNDPTVRKAEIAVETAAQNLKAVKQGSIPATALKVSYDGNHGWGLRLDFNYSFFSGYALQIRVAETSLEVAQRNLESARETAKFGIYSQRDSLKEAWSQMELLEMKKKLITLQQEMKQKQLDGGLLTEEEWEDFLIQERESENDYQKAVYNLATSYLKCKESLGMDINIEEVISSEQNP